jgi:hypothetical protein
MAKANPTTENREGMAGNEKSRKDKGKRKKQVANEGLNKQKTVGNP